MPRILARLQLEGEIFLLTFPFIEPQGGYFRLGPRTIWISAPLVNTYCSQRLIKVSIGARRESKRCREAGAADCRAVSLYATPHRRVSWAERMPSLSNVMFTSGGRESFGGPNVILCTQEVNALLEATVRL
jgi:hypothetical protein